MFFFLPNQTHFLEQYPFSFLVTLAVNVGHVIADADIAALQDHVDALFTAHDVLVEFINVPPVQTQLLDHVVGNKAVPDQVLQENRGNPFGILHVAFATGKLLDELRVDKIQAEIILQQMPDRLPIYTGTFHADLAHVVRLERHGQ